MVKGKKVKDKDPEFYKAWRDTKPSKDDEGPGVIESTGQSILSFRSNKKVKRDFRIIKIGLELPKENFMLIST
jgi:tRNA dimethylallyltransferase